MIKGLFLFSFLFYNSGNKNRVFIFLLGLICFILISRIKEKNCNHNHITVQNLGIKINVHFYIWKERDREREKNTYIRYKQLHFQLNFWRIGFIRIYRNGKLEILFNSKFNPSFEHLSFCFNLDETFSKNQHESNTNSFKSESQ